MIDSNHNPDNEQTLAIATGGFLVFSSVLFLLERLGAPQAILAWAMGAGVFSVVFLLAFSGRTTSPARFFVANRNEGITGLVMAGISDLMSLPLVMLLVFLQPAAPATSTMIALAVVAGTGLSGWFFSVPMRKSGAYSVPDFLDYRFNSRSIRLVALIIIVLISFGLLYAELRLLGMLLTPSLSFSNTQVIGAVLILSTLVCLLGGVASVSRVQATLIVLIFLAVVAVATWLATDLTGIPLPQMLLDGSIVTSGIRDEALGPLLSEAYFSAALNENLGFLLPVGLFLGFATLPHIANRRFLAKTPTLVKFTHRRSIFLAAVLLTSIPALQYTGFFNTGLIGGDNQSPMPAVLNIFVPLAVVMVAVSTTSLLLITLANALSHDGYQILRPGKVPPTRQIFISRAFVILVAVGVWAVVGRVEFSGLAAMVWVLGLATGALLPVLLCSVFLPKTTRAAVLAGMVLGLALIAAGFIAVETGFGRQLMQIWFEIDLIAGEKANPALAMLTGMAVFALVMISVFTFSKLGKTDRQTDARFEKLQDPDGEILISANLL